MAGKLYLCATPIGNLEDMTFRAVRILKEADLIAAEDTRNSIRLLNHFEIRTPMTSYHEYNKISKGHQLVQKMKEGMNIALITDAGTPGISDPGEELVSMCCQEGIEVTSVPGACALIAGITISGLPSRRFAFEAFLPSDKKERKRILSELEEETRTIVIYEAPHRLSLTLHELRQALGNRKAVLLRELTKLHESVLRTDLEHLELRYAQEKPLGECILVIEGKNPGEKEEEEQKTWMEISVEDHVSYYEKLGMGRKEAMKQAAVDRGVSRRDIYQAMLS